MSSSDTLALAARTSRLKNATDSHKVMRAQLDATPLFQRSAARLFALCILDCMAWCKVLCGVRQMTNVQMSDAYGHAWLAAELHVRSLQPFPRRPATIFTVNAAFFAHSECLQLFPSPRLPKRASVWSWLALKHDIWASSSSS